MNDKHIKTGLKLIRRLGITPSNELTPHRLAEHFDLKHVPFMHKSRYEGLWAVGRGESALGVTKIKALHLDNALNISLIGKGITFDSGGISIKPGRDMHLMKFDMLGAATVLAVANYFKQTDNALKYINLDIYGTCASNVFAGAGRQMLPGDVLTYHTDYEDDNKTVKVEVINTDAEGRLVLADGIIAAKNQPNKPDLIVTVATLTGGAKAALGPGTAIFGSPHYISQVKVAAESEGELIWPLPVWDCHRQDIKCPVKGLADIRNMGTMASASTAAAFLEHFTGDTEWVHLDIAGSAYKDEVPTGVMFKTLVRMIKDLDATLSEMRVEKKDSSKIESSCI